MEAKKSSFSVMFRIRKSKSNQAEVPIHVRITINGKRMEQLLKESIDPKNWNYRTGMAKAKRDEFKMLNNHLNKCAHPS